MGWNARKRKIKKLTKKYGERLTIEHVGEITKGVLLDENPPREIFMVRKTIWEKASCQN